MTITWTTVILLGLVLGISIALGENVEESRRESELRELLTRFLNNFDRRDGATTSFNENLVVSSMAASARTGQIKNVAPEIVRETGKQSLSEGCVTHARYRTINGQCNNPTVPQRGSTQQPFKRLLDPVYDDGVSTPRLSGHNGNPLPSARRVSRRIHEDKQRPASQDTIMVMQWGQFIDHDLTATPLHSEELEIICCTDLEPGKLHPDVTTGGPCFPIVIPDNDRRFNNCMEFQRSAAAPGREIREQINLLTPFLDGSMVYGLSDEHSQELRDGPYMKTKGKDLLPESKEEICRLDNDDDWCFEAGDFRVNVFPGLTVLHTIMVREHNRLVKELTDILPSDTPDDVLFEEARKIVSAILQHITYNEWLPVVIGQKAMTQFKLTPDSSFQYDANVDPTIANVFATAAFRYGHSAIPSFLRLRGRKVPIKELFNRPTEVIRDLDEVLESILQDKRQNVDRFVTEQMTDHLFETPEDSGFDVISLNIQRGRDHGLPPYNRFREICDLKPVSSFDNNVFSNGRKDFSKIYSDPDDIDVFSGALAEEPIDGASVGPLLACLIGKQFADIKYGDSFWHETTDVDKGFTKEQLAEIKRMTLAKVLCDNSGLEAIQRNPLKVHKQRTNPMVACCDLPTIDLNYWKR